jgi:hypothetical protein
VGTLKHKYETTEAKEKFGKFEIFERVHFGIAKCFPKKFVNCTVIHFRK